VVTAGTQQALDIVIRVLPSRDKEVWIEDPCYPLTRQALLAAGATVRPIPVDGQGIDRRSAGVTNTAARRARLCPPSDVDALPVDRNRADRRTSGQQRLSRQG